MIPNPSRRKMWWSLALVGILALLPAAFRTLLRHWESNPLLRGRQLSEELGCVECHRPYAVVEIPNPGSRWGSVPRFGAGNAMMYAESSQEIEEYIRFGAPRAWLDDPKIRARLERQQVRMPAFDDRLDRRQLADLVAYVGAIENVSRVPGEAVEAGRRLAREQGCPSCHGVEGAGGLPNPGSLGGFIPGFLGKNFTHLVRDEAEFREWVRDGTSSRLARNPLIRTIWRRQAIAMPAYRELDDDQIGLLWQWVQGLRQSDLGTELNADRDDPYRQPRR